MAMVNGSNGSNGGAPPNGNGPQIGAGGPPGEDDGPWRRGHCKWFNVQKGWGFVTPEDGGPDVFVHQSVLHMTGFRSLGDEECVEFQTDSSEKGLEATAVRGMGGVDIQGSHRRPGARTKTKTVRCFNCGDFANHLASKCPQAPMPKRCHHCKSPDHLIEGCPTLPEEQRRSQGMPPQEAGVAAAAPEGASALEPAATGGEELPEAEPKKNGKK